MSLDLDAKMRAVAQIVDGRVVNDEPALPICIKGSFSGFPVTLQSINPNWPFPVMYLLETVVIEDPNKEDSNEGLQVTICPRHGKGLMSMFSRMFLFEAHGMPIRDKLIDSNFIVTYNEHDLAERFLKYPGIIDDLLKLHNFCNFSEMQIRTQAGLYLSQPKSFAALDLDVCREVFHVLAEIGQVVFEAFS